MVVVVTETQFSIPQRRNPAYQPEPCVCECVLGVRARCAREGGGGARAGLCVRELACVCLRACVRAIVPASLRARARVWSV